MTRDPTLPRFVIIGAVKGATTWIHRQLQKNPAIFLPGPEPHYFSQDHALGLDHYRALFAGAAPGQMLGEKSADYLAHDLAPGRMAAVMPDARLVVQLRDPVARAYSDYKMLYRRGTVTGPPEDYLSGTDCDQPRFLRDGLYAEHLARWFDHFPREQMEILLFEDVKAHPAEVVASVCAHVGVDEHQAPVDDRPRNDSSERFLPLPVRRTLAPLKRMVRPLRGTPVFEGVRGLFADRIAYPPLPPALARRMRDFYARDVETLGRMIGRDTSHWLTDHRLAA